MGDGCARGVPLHSIVVALPLLFELFLRCSFITNVLINQLCDFQIIRGVFDPAGKALNNAANKLLVVELAFVVIARAEKVSIVCRCLKCAFALVQGFGAVEGEGASVCLVEGVHVFGFFDFFD